MAKTVRVKGFSFRRNGKTIRVKGHTRKVSAGRRTKRRRR